MVRAGTYKNIIERLWMIRAAPQKSEGVFYFTQKQMKRDSMIFYRSFYESVSGLSPVIKAELYDAIFEYGLNFKEIEFTNEISKALFTLIKPQLDANIKRFENGKKPKIKQSKSKTEAKDKQNKSKVEANNNVNVNNNDNNIPELNEFLDYAREKVSNINLAAVTLKYESWIESGWCTNVKGKEHKIKNWKSTLLNTLPFLPKHEIQQQRTIID